MGYFLKPLGLLAIAGVLFPAGARAQVLDTVRGLHIQRAAEGVPPGQRITLDGPRPKGPMAVIYLDGQRRDSTNLSGLDPNAIATISVLKADAARQLGPDEARLGVVVVTTKAGQHKHSTRAFDRRLRKLMPVRPPAPLPANGPK